MRNIERRKKDFVMILLGLVLIFILISVIYHPSERKDYSDFLDSMGARESSDNYHAENKFGYLGRYQMGELALQDAGFKNDDGTWTSLANSYGIFSKADFLSSSAGQDAAITACHKKLCGYIRSYRLERYIGTVYCEVKVTASGLLAACHLVGVNSMRDALKTGKMVYDGNHVSASEYMELFAGFDISEVWKQ